MLRNIKVLSRSQLRDHVRCQMANLLTGSTVKRHLRVGPQWWHKYPVSVSRDSAATQHGLQGRSQDITLCDSAKNQENIGSCCNNVALPKYLLLIPGTC